MPITNRPAKVEYVFNGVGSGDVVNTLLDHDNDLGAFRPWKGKDKRARIRVVQNGVPRTFILNAPATLRKDEWRMIDTTVMEAVYTTPMRMFADLRAAGSTITIPNAMGKSVLEYERMTDIGPATVSMDPSRESDADRPHFDLTGMPLPCIHKDFQFTARQIQISRNGGTPLDMAMPRLAARKCLEEVEKFTAGSQTYKYAGYNVYGYQNFPSRMTQTITAPTSSNHGTTISEVLSMRKKLTDKGYTGPFAVYLSPTWDNYLDEDYSTAKGTNTLRERIMAIKGVASVEVSYWLSGNTVLMVQLSPEVAQAVIGMDVVTLQWPSKGGMITNFKCLCILLPRMKADINGVTGIVHGN